MGTEDACFKITRSSAHLGPIFHDVFNRQIDIPRYSRLVPLSEISDPKNDFNLNLPRYIDSTEPEDLQDIDAHLRGGIPNRDIDALESYWKVFPSVRAALFKPSTRPGYAELKVPAADIKAAIFGHPEFTAFNQSEYCSRFLSVEFIGIDAER